MRIRHVVVATDESEAGRQAVGTALALASRAGARATVMRTLPADGAAVATSVDRLRRWVESDLGHGGLPPTVEFAVTCGVPGIEIGRFAEQVRADLLVLGRAPRSSQSRLLIGDTGDAVARRSRVPCLFVRSGEASIARVMAAVDASPRGRTVLGVADDFARAAGAELRALTVERVHAGEPAHLAAAMPTTGSARVAAQAIGTARNFEVRRGNLVEQILHAAEEQEPDVLVLGCHRGGPAGVIEAGSTARQLIHRAPCAVLTVPL